MTRLALFALVAALALVGAGCGGDDDAAEADPTVAWADSFCTALQTWGDAVESIGETLQDPASLSEDALRQAADDLSAATDTLVGDVRALGSPETDARDEVDASVEAFTDTVESEKATIEDALEGADGLTGVVGAAGTILSSVSAMVTAFQSVLTDVEAADASGELESAFEEADSCGDLSGDGS